MKRIRILIREQRLLAIAIIGFALFIKAVVPSGYMVGSSSKFLTIEICTDASGGTKTARIEVPFESSPAEQSGKHAAMEKPCAYSALSMFALASTDAALLAAVLAFILMLAFVPVNGIPLLTGSRLRPPLRGPPL